MKNLRYFINIIWDIDQIPQEIILPCNNKFGKI